MAHGLRIAVDVQQFEDWFILISLFGSHYDNVNVYYNICYFGQKNQIWGKKNTSIQYYFHNQGATLLTFN